MICSLARLVCKTVTFDIINVMSSLMMYDVCMVDKLYHRANLRSSFRPNARFVLEIQGFVCGHATSLIIEKLHSKGIAMHAYGISTYYV